MPAIGVVVVVRLRVGRIVLALACPRIVWPVIQVVVGPISWGGGKGGESEKRGGGGEEKF